MIKEKIIDLAFEIGKQEFKDRIDEHKLRDTLSNYIERQRKYNDFYSLAEEIDFQGLVEFIEENLMASVSERLFAPAKNVRGEARKAILSAAYEYSKATTHQAKKRVCDCIDICLEIIRGFYSSGISKKDYILATEVVDTVETTIQKTVEEAKREILSEINVLGGDERNKSLISIDKSIQLAEEGNLTTIESAFEKVFKHISLTHPLYPDYGYSFAGSKIKSTPLTEDAEKRHPPHLTLTGPVRIGETYFNNPNADLLTYAYRHQLPITIEVTQATKYLGEIIDPAQAEAEGLPGKAILAFPPKFPPAFPCAIKVGKNTFFDYILFRIQEILDDGTYIITNNEQGKHISFEIRYNPKQPGNPNFSINMTDADNHEILSFVRFKKALSAKKDIHICALETGRDIIAGHINSPEFNTGFPSIDEEIDFLERICALEEYFNTPIKPENGEISTEEYKNVVYLSDIIKQGSVTITWHEISFSGIVDANFREGLKEMASRPFRFSFDFNYNINLFGTNLELPLKRVLNYANIVNLEKLMEDLSNLKDGEELEFTCKAGDDNSAIDSLNITSSDS